jgi:hypothetical protein
MAGMERSVKLFEKAVRAKIFLAVFAQKFNGFVMRRTGKVGRESSTEK